MKRKDKKGRILRDGEYQREDGRYEYKYTDSYGRRHSEYSWRLVESDKTPEGKKLTTPLRDIEEKLQYMLYNGIDADRSSHMTLDQFAPRYFAVKGHLRTTTLQQYKELYKNHVQPILGNRPLEKIQYGDIVGLYSSLIQDGLAEGSVSMIHSILNNMLDLAVKDRLMLSNYCPEAKKSISNSLTPTGPRNMILTEEQQDLLLEYIRCAGTFSYLVDPTLVMLETGMRCGELAGLRWPDCDLEHGVIHVGATLVLVHGVGWERHEPKTVAGKRDIPMTNRVRDILMTHQESYEPLEKPRAGYTDYVFTRHGTTLNPSRFTNDLKEMARRCNAAEIERSKQTGDPPLLLPLLTAHCLRHTFCSRYCAVEPNLKIVQEIMGHTSVTTTINIYNSVTPQQKTDSMHAFDKTVCTNLP